MLHNLTLERVRRCGSRTTSTSSPPPRPRRSTSSPRGRSGWTCRTARRTPCSTCREGGGQNGEYTYPDDAKDPYLGGPRRTCGPSTRTERCSRPPATCTRAACATTCGCNATARSCRPTRRSPAPPTRCTSSRRSSHYYEPAGPGLVGRHDVGDARQLARAGAQGRQARDHRDLRLEARVVVRGHGHHGRVDGRRQRRHRPVHDVGQRARDPHPRPPAPRTTTTAARRPTRSTTSTRRSCRRAWCPTAT